MNLMRMIAPIMLVLMAANAAQADVGVRYGLGIFNSAKHSKAETKVIGLVYRENIHLPLFLQTEVGYFVDLSESPTRKSSAYGNASFGFEVSPSFFLFRGTHGLAAISNPDSYLGRSFPQFATDLFLGLKDGTGSSVGLGYKHISSAGLVMPNQGRDFLTLEYGIKL